MSTTDRVTSLEAERKARRAAYQRARRALARETAVIDGVKKAPGRPPKYSSEEERVAARRASQAAYARKVRAAYAAAKQAQPSTNQQAPCDESDQPVCKPSPSQSELADNLAKLL